MVIKFLAQYQTYRLPFVVVDIFFFHFRNVEWTEIITKTIKKYDDQIWQFWYRLQNGINGKFKFWIKETTKKFTDYFFQIIFQFIVLFLVYLVSSNSFNCWLKSEKNKENNLHTTFFFFAPTAAEINICFTQFLFHFIHFFKIFWNKTEKIQFGKKKSLKSLKNVVENAASSIFICSLNPLSPPSTPTKF